jgi:RNA polymerase sigma factor (sigma-70 family)
MQNSELIRDARKGNAAAQKCLFDLMMPQMQVLCRRYVRNVEDAEEMLLNGFYQFFRHLEDFRYESDEKMRAFLKRIMVNECLMFLRKQKVFEMVTGDLPEMPTLDESALNRLAAADILKLILQLPVGYRTVFNLHVIEGFSHAEIAGMLRINEGTSRSQLNKARQLLQKLLTQSETHASTKTY